MELKPQERMNKVREDAVAQLGNLANEAQIGTAEYIVKTENGPAKVTVTAIKDAEYDVEAAVATYQEVVATREAKAEARAAKKAEDEAKKAAKAKEKEEKEKAE